MAGVVMRIVPKRTLDFTSLAISQSEEIILAQNIDVSQWREVSLMVRTHTNSFSGGLGTIDIYAYMEGRTSEDPGLLFATTAALGTVTINSSTTAPAYSVNTLGANLGSMIKIAAKGTRTSSNTANAIKADISIDVSLKSA
jgi:hypothetical protein